MTGMMEGWWKEYFYELRSYVCTNLLFSEMEWHIKRQTAWTEDEGKGERTKLIKEGRKCFLYGWSEILDFCILLMKVQ